MLHFVMFTYFLRSHISDAENVESQRKNVWCDTTYRICYLPSTGAITKVALRDVDLLFQSQLFKKLISRNFICVIRLFTDFHIWHLIIAKIILCDLDLLFQGQICQSSITLKRWELAQKKRSKTVKYFLYLPLNGIIMKVVLCDLVHNFQG